MILRGWCLCGAVLVVPTTSTPLGAQQPVVVDVGVTAAHFTGDDATAAGPSIRLSVTGAAGRFFGSAEGGGLATIGAASGFATLTGGVRSSLRAGWDTDVTGELASVVGSSSSGGVGTALFGARSLWNASHGGTWVRASGHASSRTHSSLTGGGLDGGAWWSFSRAQLSATLAQEWTRAELFTGRFRTGFAGTTPVRYSEAAVALHAEGDRSSLDVGASTRRDPQASSRFEQSVRASVAYWPRAAMALVFNVSHQLPDFVRGADATDAVSVGLRFGQSAPAIARSARIRPIVQMSESSGTPGLWVLRVRAAGARQVEVMGDFTDWEAQSLVQNGAMFERTVPLASGTHRIVVRIDGGPWRPAANTPAVDDDFGGREGLLLVP